MPPELSLITLHWFLTSFASVVDIRLLLRIWDLLFYQGSLVLFQITLGMLKIQVLLLHHLFCESWPPNTLHFFCRVILLCEISRSLELIMIVSFFFSFLSQNNVIYWLLKVLYNIHPLTWMHSYTDARGCNLLIRFGTGTFDYSTTAPSPRHYTYTHTHTPRIHRLLLLLTKPVVDPCEIDSPTHRRRNLLPQRTRHPFSILCRTCPASCEMGPRFSGKRCG